MELDDYRRFYAEEIQYAGNLNSPPLIEAFARVPREKFLGPGPWQTPFLNILSTAASEPQHTTIEDPRHLYHNIAIAIDPARGLNNGHPSSLARWINALNLHPGDRAFHLGAGVGYYTAIMAEMVGPSGTVTASEVDPDLAARARANLSDYPNVTVFACDGAEIGAGPIGNNTFDAIFINAGVTHPHPPWLERLNDGGRIILPLTMARGNTNTGVGLMLMVTRTGDRFAAQVASDVAVYSCTSVRDPATEPLIANALKTISTGSPLKLKSVRLDQHEQTETCILHRKDVCLSGE